MVSEFTGPGVGPEAQGPQDFLAPPQGPPPDYSTAVGGGCQPPTNPIGPRGTPPAGCDPPPSYCIAASLPSYEQSEQLKEKLVLEDIESQSPQGQGLRLEEEPRPRSRLNRRANWEVEEEEHALLGNDFVFFTAFLTAFLFNWVGFMLLMCFCHTIAARYGALAGFGLSLAKWTLIVQRSTDLVRDDNKWLWWLILAFGFLICIRALVQFRQIKQSWPHLSSQARERLFFFY